MRKKKGYGRKMDMGEKWKRRRQRRAFARGLGEGAFLSAGSAKGRFARGVDKGARLCYTYKEKIAARTAMRGRPAGGRGIVCRTKDRAQPRRKMKKQQ